MELSVNESKFYYEDIINDYKKGKFLTKELLEKINNIFNPFANDNYINTYKNKIKLLSKRNYKVYEEIIYIKGKDISKEDYIYIVRAFNLTYKGSKIIVINNDIVYIPNVYKDFGNDFLKNEVARVIRKNRKNSFFNILKYRNKIKFILALSGLFFIKLSNKKFAY